MACGFLDLFKPGGKIRDDLGNLGINSAVIPTNPKLSLTYID